MSATIYLPPMPPMGPTMAALPPPVPPAPTDNWPLLDLGFLYAPLEGRPCKVNCSANRKRGVIEKDGKKLYYWQAQVGRKALVTGWFTQDEAREKIFQAADRLKNAERNGMAVEVNPKKPHVRVKERKKRPKKQVVLSEGFANTKRTSTKSSKRGRKRRKDDESSDEGRRRKRRRRSKADDMSEELEVSVEEDDEEDEDEDEEDEEEDGSEEGGGEAKERPLFKFEGPKTTMDAKEEYPAVRRNTELFLKGDTAMIRVAETPDQPGVVKLERFVLDPATEDMSMDVRWFYRPSDVEDQTGAAPKAGSDNEVYYSNHTDTVAVEALLGKCNVQSAPVPEGVTMPTPTFVCRYAFDIGKKKVCRLPETALAGLNTGENTWAAELAKASAAPVTTTASMAPILAPLPGLPLPAVPAGAKGAPDSTVVCVVPLEAVPK